MLGAIAGDMIGSIYEARPIKTKDFPLFDRRSGLPCEIAAQSRARLSYS